jgi:hypothetical protein
MPVFGRRAPRGSRSDEDLQAAQLAVDLFAGEALLAVDRLERSASPGDPSQRRIIANRLRYWAERFGLKGPPVEPDATDAPRILASAVGLATDPDNEAGVSLQAAIEQAGPDLTKGIADFRREFEDAYGGRIIVPGETDQWLGDSLKRLARAEVLREVVKLGATVRFSRSAVRAADELVEQGSRLQSGRAELAAAKALQGSSGRRFVARQAARVLTFAACAAGVELSSLPHPVRVALESSAGAALIVAAQRDTLVQWAAADADPRHAQLRLQAARADLTVGLNGPNPLGQRDAKAIRANRLGPGGVGRGG